jgi:nucleotide-binding universal stress UspA family protein
MVRKILVPTDFSEGSASATAWALTLARAFGASVTLLHVYQLRPYVFPDGSTFAPSPEDVTAMLGSIDDALAAAQKSAAGHGVAIETASVEGAPVEAILETARSGGFDVIVMGTHGRTGLKHLLLGSVAERVVRLADRPVVTVRQGVAVEAEAR